MADDISFLEWVLGGLGTVTTGVGAYLMNTTNNLSQSIAAYKTHVSEKYVSKEDFLQASSTFTKNFDRLEKRIEDGNRANLDSNASILSKIDSNQNTIITMISNIRDVKGN